MFNPQKVSEEIFATLRSYNYEVAIFDEEGNKVYQPDDARRFFTNRNNIMVSLSEDSENSCVEVRIGVSVKLKSIEGLLETIRVLANKFGIGYNVRKYHKTIEPKDFIDGKLQESKLDGSTRSSYLKMNDARMLIRHEGALDLSKHGARSRNIQKIIIENSDGERFLMPSTNLMAAKAMTRHVSRGGTWNDNLGGYIADNALKQKQFKNMLVFIRPRKDLDDVKIVCREGMRQTREMFGELFRNYSNNSTKYIEQSEILHEDDDQYQERVDALTEKLNLEENSVIDRSTVETVARAMKVNENNEVAIQALDMNVDKTAWDQFRHGNMEVRGSEKFAIPALGPTADSALIALQTITPRLMDDSLSVLLARVAERIADGDRSTILLNIANKALDIAKNIRGFDVGKVDMTKVTDGDDDLEESMVGESVDMLTLANLNGLQIPRSVWNDLSKGNIDFDGQLHFSAPDNQVTTLRDIAAVAADDYLSAVLYQTADDIDLGRGQPFHENIVKAAIHAAKKKSDVIMTESVKFYGKWIDGFRTNSLFESEFGDNDVDLESANSAVLKNFDFDIEDAKDALIRDFIVIDEPEVIPYSELHASFQNYIEKTLLRDMWYHAGIEYLDADSVEEYLVTTLVAKYEPELIKDINDNYPATISPKIIDEDLLLGSMDDEGYCDDEGYDEEVIEGNDELDYEEIVHPRDAETDFNRDVMLSEDIQRFRAVPYSSTGPDGAIFYVRANSAQEAIVQAKQEATAKGFSHVFIEDSDGHEIYDGYAAAPVDGEIDEALVDIPYDDMAIGRGIQSYLDTKELDKFNFSDSNHGDDLDDDTKYCDDCHEIVEPHWDGQEDVCPQCFNTL